MDFNELIGKVHCYRIKYLGLNSICIKINWYFGLMIKKNIIEQMP